MKHALILDLCLIWNDVLIFPRSFGTLTLWANMNVEALSIYHDILFNFIRVFH